MSCEGDAVWSLGKMEERALRTQWAWLFLLPLLLSLHDCTGILVPFATANRWLSDVVLAATHQMLWVSALTAGSRYPRGWAGEMVESLHPLSLTEGMIVRVRVLPQMRMLILAAVLASPVSAFVTTALREHLPTTPMPRLWVLQNLLLFTAFRTVAYSILVPLLTFVLSLRGGRFVETCGVAASTSLVAASAEFLSMRASFGLISRPSMFRWWSIPNEWGLPLLAVWLLQFALLMTLCLFLAAWMWRRRNRVLIANEHSGS